MPRTRRTQSGQHAQPSTPVSGQRYGERKIQAEMQAVMPLPQSNGPPMGSAPVAPPMGATPVDPAAARQALHQQAAAVPVPPGGLLKMPTQRPGEPVTHGLPSGPGGGPEVLGQAVGTPVGQAMRQLAMETGNPYLKDIADRIGA